MRLARLEAWEIAAASFMASKMIFECESFYVSHEVANTHALFTNVSRGFA